MMDEKVIMEQILASADEVEIPESLLPENIKKKLAASAISDINAGTGEKPRNITRKISRYAELAAAICVLIVGGYFAEQNMRSKNAKKEAEETFSAVQEKSVVNKSAQYDMGQAEFEIQEARYEADADVYYEEAEEFAQEDTAMEDMAMGLIITEGEYQYSVNEEHNKIDICKTENPSEIIGSMKLEDGCYIQDLRVEKDRLILTLQGESEEVYIDISNPEAPEFVN